MRQGDQPTIDALLERHLLALPDTVAADEVECLALSRYPATRWASPTELRLNRYSSFHGPYRLTGSQARLLELGERPTVYAMHTLTERIGPPMPGPGDPDGISRAFPDGMPHREEGRMVSFMVAVARRLSGVVRVAGSGVVLAPDPLSSVDLGVHSDVWLTPDAALAVVRSVLASAEFVRDDFIWRGPMIDLERPPHEVDIPIDERQLIHQASEAIDAAALAEPVVREAYALTGAVGADGSVHVLIGGDDDPPLALAGAPWASGGVITYRVEWTPADPDQLDLEFPSAEHLDSRRRIIPIVSAVAKAIQAAVAGDVTDRDGFLVDPDDL